MDPCHYGFGDRNDVTELQWASDCTYLYLIQTSVSLFNLCTLDLASVYICISNCNSFFNNAMFRIMVAWISTPDVLKESDTEQKYN